MRREEGEEGEEGDQTCKIDKPSINKRRNKRLTEIECFVMNVSIFGFTERE